MGHVYENIRFCLMRTNNAGDPAANLYNLINAFAIISLNSIIAELLFAKVQYSS